MNRLAFVLLFTLPTVSAAETKNWPQFRGANVDGLAEGDTLPDTWSTTENVVWKTPLPGWGWSSPVIWGNRIFVTSAASEEALKRPKVGGYPGGRVHPKDVHRWMTYCLDFDTGKIVWQREAHKGVPPEQRHPRNSYANATPITDGERVYAYFGNIGLFCYDMAGRKLWERRWGSFPIRGGWGPGASPVLHGDRLFLVNDNEKSSFMVALDKRSGKEIWRIKRRERSNWSTPYVWENKLRTEIVTIGTGRIRSYGLDGKLLWELAGTSGLVSLTPVAKHGLLYVGAGYHYGPIYAVRPGAAGDITLKDGETSNTWIAWSHPRGSSIHPCYLISGGRLYVLFDAGILICYDAKTGKVVFPRRRLKTGSSRGRFYASPWAYNGKLFLLNEDGTTLVVEDGPEFKLLGRNVLGDNTWATPAIARGSLFIRTYTSLYRLQKRKAESGRRKAESKVGKSKVEGRLLRAIFPISDVRPSTFDPRLSDLRLPALDSFTTHYSPLTTHQPAKRSWTKSLKDRSKRGTLHDVRQFVRGDSGKWNDEARLQRVPPVSRKPAKVLLDDWAAALLEKQIHFKPDDENWLLFHSRQLNDNDRLWVEKIERKGNRFTIVAAEAVWGGRYGKNFTYHSVLGVNLGKLPPGKYEAKWIVKPLDFRAFEKPAMPRNARNNWPKDERAADRKASELTLTLTVGVKGSGVENSKLRPAVDRKLGIIPPQF